MFMPVYRHCLASIGILIIKWGSHGGQSSLYNGNSYIGKAVSFFFSPGDIASSIILGDAVTYPCLWYLLLTSTASLKTGRVWLIYHTSQVYGLLFHGAYLSWHISIFCFFLWRQRTDCVSNFEVEKAKMYCIYHDKFTNLCGPGPRQCELDHFRQLIILTVNKRVWAVVLLCITESPEMWNKHHRQWQWFGTITSMALWRSNAGVVVDGLVILDGQLKHTEYTNFLFNNTLIK